MMKRLLSYSCARKGGAFAQSGLSAVHRTGRIPRSAVGAGAAVLSRRKGRPGWRAVGLPSLNTTVPFTQTGVNADGLRLRLTEIGAIGNDGRIEEHEVGEEIGATRPRLRKPTSAAARLDIFRTASSSENSFLSRTYGPSTLAKLPKPRGCSRTTARRCRRWRTATASTAPRRRRPCRSRRCRRSPPGSASRPSASAPAWRISVARRPRASCRRSPDVRESC